MNTIIEEEETFLPADHGSLRTFCVERTYTQCAVIEVEAHSAQEAEEIAMSANFLDWDFHTEDLEEACDAHNTVTDYETEAKEREDKRQRELLKNNAQERGSLI